MISDTATHQFTLDGGHPGLDFANTLEGRHDNRIEERIPDYQALLAFAAATELIDRETRERLIRDAGARPHEAASVHAAARALREALFAAASALVGARDPDPADLRVISRAGAAAHAAGAFIQNGEGFRWSWERATTRLELPYWQLADAALDLLGHEDLSRLRVCAADDCDWLFLDDTRNRSRKWCDMSTCGNRAKVARYRRRRD